MLYLFDSIFRNSENKCSKWIVILYNEQNIQLKSIYARNNLLKKTGISEKCPFEIHILIQTNSTDLNQPHDRSHQ